MLERRDALPVGEVWVRATLDEEPHDLRVARVLLAEDDRLQERRPAEVIDVVGCQSESTKASPRFGRARGRLPG